MSQLIKARVVSYCTKEYAYNFGTSKLYNPGETRRLIREGEKVYKTHETAHATEREKDNGNNARQLRDYHLAEG